MAARRPWATSGSFLLSLFVSSFVQPAGLGCVGQEKLKYVTTPMQGSQTQKKLERDMERPAKKAKANQSSAQQVVRS